MLHTYTYYYIYAGTSSTALSDLPALASSRLPPLTDMLSSLGFDNKGAGRTNHSGSRVRILAAHGVACFDAVAD